MCSTVSSAKVPQVVEAPQEHQHTHILSGSSYLSDIILLTHHKAPISHYHLLQTESFHVESGEGLWYLQGKTIYLKAGDDITIPRFVAHRFENVPGSTQPLSILYRYDAQRYDMERRFFCNTLTYLDDCRVAGVSPSVLQLCIFLSDCWMPGDFLWVPGGEHVRCLVNALFMWTMAAIGRLVFGYKGAYSEYYAPKVGGEYFKSSSKKVT